MITKETITKTENYHIEVEYEVIQNVITGSDDDTSSNEIEIEEVKRKVKSVMIFLPDGNLEITKYLPTTHIERLIHPEDISYR
jgi:hypothetical protein